MVNVAPSVGIVQAVAEADQIMNANATEPSMNNEYKPLHELILEVLEEGTVLETEAYNEVFIWSNGALRLNGEIVGMWNPLNHKWRVISTPPKKIEFETQVVEDLDEGGELIALPNDIFEPGTKVRVTVEEKR